MTDNELLHFYYADRKNNQFLDEISRRFSDKLRQNEINNGHYREFMAINDKQINKYTKDIEKYNSRIKTYNILAKLSVILAVIVKLTGLFLWICGMTIDSGTFFWFTINLPSWIISLLLFNKLTGFFKDKSQSSSSGIQFCNEEIERLKQLNTSNMIDEIMNPIISNKKRMDEEEKARIEEEKKRKHDDLVYQMEHSERVESLAEKINSDIENWIKGNNYSDIREFLVSLEVKYFSFECSIINKTRYDNLRFELNQTIHMVIYDTDHYDQELVKINNQQRRLENEIKSLFDNPLCKIPYQVNTSDIDTLCEVIKKKIKSTYSNPNCQIYNF